MINRWWVAIIVAAVSQTALADLYIELGAGHSSRIDSIGNESIGARPMATAELGYQHNGWGVSYLHVSDPTAKDNGINMLRATKRFTWFK